MKVAFVVHTLEALHGLGAVHVAVAYRHGNLLDGSVGSAKLKLMPQGLIEVLGVGGDSKVVIGSIKFDLGDGLVGHTGVEVLQAGGEAVVIGRNIEEVHSAVKLVV